ncbi:MAG: F0F1 ATP synthase subunit B [Patescibacteria group bacterium UBA2103]
MSELFHAFGIDWKLLVFQIINFGILVGALWFFLYKPVLKMLKDRESMVAKGVEDAQAAEKAREEIESSKDEILKGAEHEAHDIVEGAKQHGKDEQKKIVDEANLRAAKLEEDAKLRAKEVKEKAKKDAEKDVARLAILAAEKVLEKK